MANGTDLCHAGVAGTATLSASAGVVDRHIGVFLGGNCNHDFAGDLRAFLGKTCTNAGSAN